MSVKIKFDCLSCHRTLAVAAQDSGVALRCPHCGVYLQTPTGIDDDTEVRLITEAEYQESKAERATKLEEQEARRRKLKQRWLAFAIGVAVPAFFALAFFPYLRARSAEKKTLLKNDTTPILADAELYKAAEKELEEWFANPSSEIPAMQVYLEQAKRWGLDLGTRPSAFHLRETKASPIGGKNLHFLVGRDHGNLTTRFMMHFDGEEFEFLPIALVEGAHGLFDRFCKGEFSDDGFFLLQIERVHSVGKELPEIPEEWGKFLWLKATSVVTPNSHYYVVAQRSKITAGDVTDSISTWGRRIGTECYLSRKEHGGNQILLLEATQTTALDLMSSNFGPSEDPEIIEVQPALGVPTNFGEDPKEEAGKPAREGSSDAWPAEE